MEPALCQLYRHTFVPYVIVDMLYNVLSQNIMSVRQHGLKYSVYEILPRQVVQKH